MIDITEKQFAMEVIDLAKYSGCDKIIHHLWSKGTEWGWPDYTFLWQEPARCIFAELKAEGKNLTADQSFVLEMLMESGNEAYCWWPSDIELIKGILRWI